MSQTQDQTNLRCVSMLVSLCFDARTAAHIAHLNTRSFSSHLALNDFYNKIGELGDEYAEAAIGLYGIDIIYTRFELETTPVLLVEKVRQWISLNREECGRQEIQAIIDSILNLCNSTLYKLKRLN
jgi:hypothetical protein